MNYICFSFKGHRIIFVPVLKDNELYCLKDNDIFIPVLKDNNIFVSVLKDSEFSFKRPVS